MREQIHLATIGGIRVGANWSVLVVVVLIAWSLASNFFPAAAPGFSALAYWLAAAVAAVLFLASITLHELAHSMLARRLGVGVEGITLWMFGGVSSIKGDAPSAGAEAKIAAVGPATSLALAAIFAIANTLLAAAGASPLLVTLAAWLALINFILGLFNLLPGFPLDGGRLLRAILWRIGHERDRATIRAAAVGEVVGTLMIAAGLFLVIFGRDLVGGLWMMFLGSILRGAAASERRHVEIIRPLVGLTVGDLMSPRPPTLPATMMLDEFLARPQMLGFDTFPVVDRSGTVEGLVDLRRLLDVSPQDRATTSLGSIAVPVAKVARATPDEPVTALWDRIGSDANSPVLVMLDGRPAGILSPHDISRALYSAHRQQGHSRPA